MEDKIGCLCRVRRRDGKCIQTCSENLKQKGHFEDKGIGGRMILKCILWE
jgi:hypothetical protein